MVKARSDQIGAGAAIQVASSLYSAVATGTTIIPLDDTIPQNTEGTEFMTLTITPKAATNILVIEVDAMVAVSIANGNPVMALFQDSIANALYAKAVFQASVNGEIAIPIKHSMAAGTTSAITFRVRIGNRAAATVTLNGSNAARELGTTPKSSIIITEYGA